MNGAFPKVEDDDQAFDSDSEESDLKEYRDSILTSVTWDDKDEVLAEVTKDGFWLFDASEELKSDREIVSAAVNQFGLSLQHASEELRADREVVLAAVKQNGEALEYASEQLKSDGDVVLAAVNQTFGALKYVSEELKLGGDNMLSSEDVENVLLDDHDQCPTKDDQLKLYKSINMSRKFTSPEDFGEAIMNNLNSPICIGWLNKLSCSRRVVAFMMLEFYLHITLICSFLQASEQHLTEINPNYAWARVMLPVSTVFLGFEFWQFWGYWKHIKRPARYFMDGWNWIDLATIGLSLASATKLLTEEPAAITSMQDSIGTRRLLTATAFFMCVFFLSYLRKNFLSFAIFVGGFVNIIYVLIPFIIVSFFLLGTFAFGYFVLNEGDKNYMSMEGSLITVYGVFIGDDPTVDASTLEVIFGLLIIIVLLNVVIAVVSQAWSEVSTRSTEVYWIHRLTFILEVTRGYENERHLCGDMSGLRQILDEDWNSHGVKNYLGYKIKEHSQHAMYWNPTRKEEDNLLQRGATIFLLFCLTILGFISFGLLWPMFILEFLFTSRIEKDSEESAEVKTLKAENENLVKQIDEQSKQIQMMSQHIQSLFHQLETQSQQAERLTRLLVSQHTTNDKAKTSNQNEIDHVGVESARQPQARNIPGFETTEQDSLFDVDSLNPCSGPVEKRASYLLQKLSHIGS